MSEENKIVELKEEDLEKVNGGDNVLYFDSINCQCNCNKKYILYDYMSDGTILGTCTNGWEATYHCAPQGYFVAFYNKELNQTIIKYL